MTVPAQPKIYHIVHVDRLPSIIASGELWCDAVMMQHPRLGTAIGMDNIKRRRLKQLKLSSHPNLYVGQCVPFYFCPRSVMLYVISRCNHDELHYQGGQDPIVHLEFDLHAVVRWADANNRRWEFTLSNAGAFYCEDRCNLSNLDEINWKAMRTNNWHDRTLKQDKQAEFLIESSCPWSLVERIGIANQVTRTQAGNALSASSHNPGLEIKPEWYYR